MTQHPLDIVAFLRSFTIKQIAFKVKKEVKAYLWRLTPQLIQRAYLTQQRQMYQASAFTNSRFRFFFLQEERSAIANFSKQYDSKGVQDVITVADRLCQGEFHFLNLTHSFDGEIDWDWGKQKKRYWNDRLNRLEFLVTLGKAYHFTLKNVYPQTAVKYLGSWLERFYSGADLCCTDALEWSKRIDALLWTDRLLTGYPLYSEDLRTGVLGVMAWAENYISRNLSYHAPGNHLISEAKGLFISSLFTSGTDSKANGFVLGKRILEQETITQFHDDGFHKEQSTTYFLITLLDLLEVWRLSEINGILFDNAMYRCLEVSLNTLHQFLRPDGKLFALGDADSADPPIRPADLLKFGVSALPLPYDFECRHPITENLIWRLGVEDTQALLQSSEKELRKAETVLLSESGYLLARLPDQDFFLTFDCGPLGYEKSPAHGHADALSVNLYCYGTEMLIDPGRYTYEKGKLRDFFRGTKAHNTASIGGFNQSNPIGAFRWGRIARTQIDSYDQTEDNISIKATIKQGFTESDRPHQHSRQIRIDSDGVIFIRDEFSGTGMDFVETYFHLAPSEVREHKELKGLLAVFENNASLLIRPQVSFDYEWEVVSGCSDGQGSFSPEYGRSVAAPTLVYRFAPVPEVIEFVLMAFCA